MKLTKEMIENAPLRSIIFEGITTDDAEGLNMTMSGKKLRYVVVRGGFTDWCVYTHFAFHDAEWIRRHGDKPHGKGNINHIIDFDDEVWEIYRH